MGVAAAFDTELFEVFELQKAALDFDVFGIGVVLRGRQSVDEVKRRLICGRHTQGSHNAERSASHCCAF